MIVVELFVPANFLYSGTAELLKRDPLRSGDGRCHILNSSVQNQSKMIPLGSTISSVQAASEETQFSK
jgi:hypothetical protein